MEENTFYFMEENEIPMVYLYDDKQEYMVTLVDFMTRSEQIEENLVEFLIEHGFSYIKHSSNDNDDQGFIVINA